MPVLNVGPRARPEPEKVKGAARSGRWRVPSVALILTAALGSISQPAPAQTTSPPDSGIRIRSVADITRTRRALVRYIWGTTWADVLARQPTETHDGYVPVAEDALPVSSSLENLDRIEQIVVAMVQQGAGGGRVGHTSTAYVFHPQVSNGRVVIIHQGHGCILGGFPGDSGNLDVAINVLLRAHYAVVGMRMPLFQRPSECGHDAASTSHGDMFSNPAQQLRTGNPLQFFLEPVARVLNYLQRKYPSYREFDMIGLSGGGWTTTVYAAIDPRIVLSFPVAGSLPFDVDMGIGGRDAEQTWPEFYRIAGYKDLYIMGAYGAHRGQIQILNQHDDCCFTPAPQEAARYACDVAIGLHKLGAGAFVLDYDASAYIHELSLAAISGVILPVLQAGLEPSGRNCTTAVGSLLLYDPHGGDNGAAAGVFYNISPDGVLTRVKEYRDWRNSWAIVTPAGPGLLFYDPHGGIGGVGYGAFYRVDLNGQMTLVREYPDWRSSWTIIVAPNAGNDDLLFYDPRGGTGGAGGAVLYHVDLEGTMTLVREYRDWPSSWTSIVSSPSTGLVLFHQAWSAANTADHWAFYRIDSAGNVALVRDYWDYWGFQSYRERSPWTIVPNLPSGLVLLYSSHLGTGGPGDGVLLRVDGRGSLKFVQEYWPLRSSWAAIVSGTAWLLFYDPKSGTNGAGLADVYTVDANGNMRLLKQYTDWWSGWTSIVADPLGSFRVWAEGR